MKNIIRSKKRMTSLNQINNGLALLKHHYDKQLEIAKNSGIENDIRWVDMKYNHSLDVFHVCEFLINNDNFLSKLDDKYKLYGQLSAILHDIGRAYKIGENRDKVEPHGAFGSDKVLRDMEKIDNPFILIPVKYHDVLEAEEQAKKELKKYDLSARENEIVIILLKLVMDSDRLANFELFKTLNNKFFLNLKKELYFSKKSLNAFKNRKLLTREERETLFDQILFYSAWVYDLNFEASKKFVIEHKNMEAFIKMMNKAVIEIAENNKNNNNDTEKINNQIQNIKNQFIQDGLIV